MASPPPTPPAAPGERPRLGRPPRINRAIIAEAAHELGLDGLTLRAVAEHLGVSIAALYHYVSSKDELVRVAAEYTVARVPLPQDQGQHWAVWLAEWGDYNHDAFLARPGLLAQYLEGGIAAETIAGNVDVILGVLVRQGFDVLEANAAYELVTSCAIGMAVAAIRERAATGAGESVRDAHRRLLHERGPDELPHLRALHEAIADHGRASLREQVTTAIRGIAARRGAEWAPIQAALDAAG